MGPPSYATGMVSEIIPKAFLAGRLETGRELVKLRYDERINNLRTDAMQIGDSSVE
jgi:hypothetical protein